MDMYSVQSILLGLLHYSGKYGKLRIYYVQTTK